MLHKYKNVFSSGDEIGTCPNIEGKIEVTPEYLFFIRPYQVKEEKAVIKK